MISGKKELKLISIHFLCVTCLKKNFSKHVNYFPTIQVQISIIRLIKFYRFRIIDTTILCEKIKKKVDLKKVNLFFKKLSYFAITIFSTARLLSLEITTK